MSEILKPSVALLVKLASIAVHVEELLSPHGHPVDRYALQALLEDAEVKEWIQSMNSMGFLPVKRNT